MPDGGVIAVEPPLVRPDPPELDHEGRGAEEEDGERVGEDGGEGGQPRHVPEPSVVTTNTAQSAVTHLMSDTEAGSRDKELQLCSQGGP